MKKGYIYNIVKDRDTLGLDEADIYDYAYYNIRVEDVEHTKKIISDFADMLKKYSAIIKDEGNCYSVIFPDGFKEKFFVKKYYDMQDMVKNMSLHTFASDSSAIWNLQETIARLYGDAIYDGYRRIYSLDDFIRSATIDCTYYLGKSAISVNEEKI